MKALLSLIALVLVMGACSLIKYSNKTKDVPVYVHDTTVITKLLSPKIDTFTTHKRDTIWKFDTTLIVGKKTIKKIPLEIHDTTIKMVINESELNEIKDSVKYYKRIKNELSSNTLQLNQEIIDRSHLCWWLGLLGFIFLAYAIFISYLIIKKDEKS